MAPAVLRLLLRVVLLLLLALKFLERVLLAERRPIWIAPPALPVADAPLVERLLWRPTRAWLVVYGVRKVWFYTGSWLDNRV